MAPPRLPALCDRIHERGVLERLLECGRRGQSAVLVVSGEAGVGKTALLQYAAQRASGFRLAEIAGVEAEMELPYAGLHQLCRSMLKGLDAIPQHQNAALGVALGLSPGEAPDRFLVALAALGLLSAAAGERPLLCVVDDVQWLDKATRQVLGFVARRLLAEPVAMIFGVREPGHEPELSGLPELRLDGLHEEDARVLLASVVPGPLDERVRDRLLAETRGNPLALLELPRGMTAAELGGGFALPDAGTLPGQLENHYLRRLEALPESTKRLLLVAAADPVGDAPLLRRAARTLGIGAGAAAPAAKDGLLEIGARVRFRHPLVRSAVYRAASEAERRAAHRALAAVTDPDVDPDRRTWHRAHATIAPDDDVALELLERAARAEARGGIAATAAFLECACALTSEPTEQAARALAAARAKFAAGDAAAAESLLATAEAGPLDELALAQIEHLRAQIAFDLRRGRDAPPMLLHAAQRLEPFDADLARETYLEALLATIYAGRLAERSGMTDITVVARSVPHDREPLPAREQLLTGLATRLTVGYAAAAPVLRDAVRAHREDEAQLDWLSVLYIVAAQDLWDGDSWLEFASRQAELARRTGTLSLLPYALDYLAGYHVHAGELSAAAGLSSEAEGLAPGARAATLPYIPLLLAAWRGDRSTFPTLAQAMTVEANVRGEGCAITVAAYAAAVLHNGLGEYQLALDSAQQACEGDEPATASWALPELVEAASRAGRAELASATAHALAERARASGTSWAQGTAARALALVSGGDAAEELYREAITCLERSHMGAHLARGRLSYGEWLRRAGRRADAREQLHRAYDGFAAMGARSFADRARRELVATGEKVRRRRADTPAELTSQELHIARLAREGRTNSEIGANLFLSDRTVEWHLRKVFAKLQITSRRELRTALGGRDPHSDDGLVSTAHP
jgi:DNA-binding CsgD family transcriptional regulator